MNKNFKKTICLLAIIVTFSSIVSGCGIKPAKVSLEQSSSSKNQVRKIVVGTGNALKPFCFLDEKGNLVGFEIDILTKVDELLPQYEFSFDAGEFKSILIGVDAGKYDLAAHNYAKNAEREKNYLYGTEPYGGYSYQIVVKQGRTDIKTLADLEGKTVISSSGNNVSYFLEEYNKTTAKKPINITYGSLDTEILIKGLEEGRYDANITTVRTINEWKTTYNNRVDGVGEEILPGYTYYIFKKEDTQFRDDVDSALKKLRADGTLSKLSLKWFNHDYTVLVPELETKK